MWNENFYLIVGYEGLVAEATRGILHRDMTSKRRIGFKFYVDGIGRTAIRSLKHVIHVLKSGPPKVIATWPSTGTSSMQARAIGSGFFVSRHI